ncbi:hypothetical protein Daqu01_02873 [Deinococcus aquaticus]|uniref:hypothetical protein n=1 Tax=Deinococcus aquaticus TaxID=328692 RepID=UPI0030B4157E
MNDRDKATLKLLLGQCCCPDEKPPVPRSPLRPAVHGRPMGRRPPQVDEEIPFLPPVPWYATGQRPSDFGSRHVPGNGPDGRPLSRTGNDDTQRAFTLDDGSLRSLPTTYTVDHEARVIRPAEELLGVQETATSAPGEYLVTGTRVWTFISGANWMVPEPSTFTSSTFTRRYNLLADRVIPYATGTESNSTRTVTRSNQAQWIDFTYQDQEMFSNSVPPVRPIELRFEAFKGSSGEVSFSLIGRVNRGLGTPDEEHRMGLGSWLVPIPTGQFLGAPNDAEVAYPFAPNQIYDLPREERTRSAPIRLVWAPLETGAQPDLLPFGERWRGPGGVVTLQGKPTDDHARLGGTDILSCPAGSWSGPGSWAAYRRGAGGTVLLIEHSGQMTRVDLPLEGEPPTTQSVPLSTFLAGLGLKPADWQGFGRAGPLHNTWPPHEAVTRDLGATET